MRVALVRRVVLALLALFASGVSSKAEQDSRQQAPSAYDERLQRSVADELSMTMKRNMIEDQCGAANDGCNNHYRIQKITIPYIRARFLKNGRMRSKSSYLILSDSLRIEYIHYMTAVHCMRPRQYKCLWKMLPDQTPISGTEEAAGDFNSSSWLSAGSDPMPFVNLRSIDLDIGCLPIDTRLTAARADLPGRRAMALNSLCRSGSLP